MMGLVTVVIPNFNGARYLNDSINSVLAQDYADLEIIVVDDGSTDDSIAILESYNTKIRLIKQTNKGSAAARNLGITLANGEFIALLDADDIWEENKISIQMKLFEVDHFDLVYCSGQEFFADLDEGIIHIPKYSGDCYSYFKKYPTKGIIELGCSTAVFRKSILRFSGLFDESFRGAAEDWDFFRRFTRYANVGFSSEVLVRYRKHPESVSSRSLTDFYEGNKHAIAKMFHEDSTIGYFEQRRIWFKFYLIIIKSNLRQLNYLQSFKSLIRLFKAIF